jgi:N-acetylglucosaminyl-diphospho-decaprenol L-rhamnosyltransferase
LQLSIIIVNYNVKYFLEQCLYSVIKASGTIDAEVFVVDNNSNDGSKDFFSDKFSSVKFIWNTENTGYAKANNQALQLCSGKYILFLNPDTILPEDCFSKCIRFLESDEMIGAIGIKMIDGTGNFLKESKRGFPSPVASLYKLCGLAWLFPHSKIFAAYYLGHLDKNKNHTIDVVAGAFMMVPKKVLATVGSLDETFFMYGEDIDLSYRIQKGGFKNTYFSESTIIHFKGESTNKSSVLYLKLFYNAMHLFVKKHYDFTRSSVLYLFIKLLIGLQALLSVITTTFSLFVYLFATRKNIHEKMKKLIVAKEEEYDEVVSLLKKAGVKLSITARVEPGNSIKSTKSIGTVNMLPSLIKKYSIEEIIFCEKDMSFKEIINSIELYQKEKVTYMFHASGSSSIVGSDNKNTPGIFMAAK